MDLKLYLFVENAFVRIGMKSLLETSRFQVLGEAFSASKISAQDALCAQANVFIFDLDDSPAARLKKLREVKTKFPSTPLLVYSRSLDAACVVEALSNGANGYLTGKGGSKELLTAINRLAQRKPYFSPELSDVVIEGEDGKEKFVAAKGLSKREREVAAMLANGLTNAKIAQRLSLHPKTISSFRARILEKLRLKTNADIIRYGLKPNLAASPSSDEAAPRCLFCRTEASSSEPNTS